MPVYNFIDLTEQQFDRLTVLERSNNGDGGKTRWKCICTCGKEAIVAGRDLRSGHTKSCGCLQRDNRYISRTTHGHTRDYGPSPEYNSWRAAKERCSNPKNKKFHHYGGRKIGMCEQWRDSFAAFLKDMGPRPEGTSLDRYPNPNGNYEPGNCRWATLKEQHNNKINSIRLTFDGSTLSLAEWAQRINIPENALYQRVHTLHWPTEKALTTPYKILIHRRAQPDTSARPSTEKPQLKA